MAAAHAPPVSFARTAAGASLAAIWRVLGSVADPEIPVISIVELGIVRGVAKIADEWVITLTPTYSGCPATRVIEADVRAAIAAVTDAPVRVVTALSPAWSTDWIAPEARRKLGDSGIAPPHAVDDGVRVVAFPPRVIRCPRCGSIRTQEVARFGSTPCKAQYRCAECLEPFDYVKPH